MQTAIIINDQDNALHALIGMLSNFNSLQLKITGTGSTLDEGVRLIKQNNPDIVFLDIDQSEQDLNAFYTQFKDPTFKSIFITAYQQQAIEASKNTAFDYLLKPVSLNDLQIILQRIAQQMLIEQKSNEQETKSLNDAQSHAEGTNIIFDVENGFIFENTANIEYCSANQSYALVKLHSGKEILIAKSLKQLAETFPLNTFYRVHKSYLVNIFYIRRFIKAKESYIILKSGLRIPVAVRISPHITKDIKQMILGETFSSKESLKLA